MKEFEMSEEQHSTLLKGCTPPPLIALQCGSTISLQERANNAWEELGNELGFKHMTVKPNGKGQRFFIAEPK